MDNEREDDVRKERQMMVMEFPDEFHTQKEKNEEADEQGKSLYFRMNLLPSRRDPPGDEVFIRKDASSLTHTEVDKSEGSDSSLESYSFSQDPLNTQSTFFVVGSVFLSIISTSLFPSLSHIFLLNVCVPPVKGEVFFQLVTVTASSNSTRYRSCSVVTSPSSSFRLLVYAVICCFICCFSCGFHRCMSGEGRDDRFLFRCRPRSLHKISSLF